MAPGSAELNKALLLVESWISQTAKGINKRTDTYKRVCLLLSLSGAGDDTALRRTMPINRRMETGQRQRQRQCYSAQFFSSSRLLDSLGTRLVRPRFLPGSSRFCFCLLRSKSCRAAIISPPARASGVNSLPTLTDSFCPLARLARPG
ncbi:hypothetical protein BDA96_06G092700 [Sorghum bicolor]|uniref:Uncharacterized protein n=1 Tax=Sorghum bicolor TaxID=4558 RepID=A0A921QS25_SORBI|nr:hypothetical protein BDA96_06G092700 [Sorghum bicolor]